MKIESSQAVFWTTFSMGPWQLIAAATTNGLCFVGSPDEGLDELKRWLSKQLPDRVLAKDDALMEPYVSQLNEYLQGRRTEFTFPIDYYGTAFQQSVWQALAGISFGQTSSYSDIANTIRKPQAVRAVGAAIGANPVLIAVPCHRVIGKNGTLTGYRGGLPMKTELLQLEEQRAKQQKIETA